MYSTSARRCFLEWVTFLALVALPASLPLQCQAASNAASTPGCNVQATNYLGWTAEELANPWAVSYTHLDVYKRQL